MGNRTVGGKREGIVACGKRDRELAKGQGEGSLEGGDIDDEESGGRKGILSPNTPRRRTMAEGRSQSSPHAKIGMYSLLTARGKSPRLGKAGRSWKCDGKRDYHAALPLLLSTFTCSDCSPIRIATMSQSYPRQSVRSCNAHKGVTKLQSLWRKQSLRVTLPRGSEI